MDRRLFTGLLAGSLLVSTPLVRAQQAGKTYRIGWLRQGVQPLPKLFWDALRELGWIEGQNIKIEPRYATAAEQFPELAAELVRLKVDLILANTTPASRAARDATAAIPIVFVVGADPVANGLVASLGRPGGNLTGFAYGLYEEKLLETLKAALPRLSRVAVPFVGAPTPELVRAATELGVELQHIAVRGPDDFDGRFFEIARTRGAEAVLIPDIHWVDPILERVGGATLNARLPAIGPYRDFVIGGGLLSYGGALSQHWPRTALQVDKILRGAKPGDLPVEQPTKFATVINLKTAKALGLTLPQWLILSADEVIQ